jgi:hypothetical protein
MKKNPPIHKRQHVTVVHTRGGNAVHRVSSYPTPSAAVMAYRKKFPQAHSITAKGC